jgi:hypothetical protein
MVKASGQIEQNLAQLQHKTAELADELDSLYQGYLKALSQAARQKLLLAAYHLCTQIYPEPFLALNVSQRGRLQTLLQQLGHQLHEQLLTKWVECQQLSRRPSQENGLSLIKQLFLRLESGADNFAEEDSHDEDDDEEEDDLEAVLEELTDNSPEIEVIKARLLKRPLLEPEEQASEEDQTSQENQDQDTLDVVESKLLDHPEANGLEVMDELAALDLEALDSSEAPDIEEVSGPLEPIHLVRQQLLMEKAIRDVLKALSETANYLLQQADIIPELPKALLTAAAESDGLAQTPIKTPNLLKISVKVFHGSDAEESGQGKKQRRPKLVQLEAFPDFFVIHLRLSEIEFAESKVLMWRSQIREKMGKIKQLGSAYQKAQRELAIANAEEAWRASWVEE